ncbi:MAG: PIN domain-containing protein [Planctomycetaceae bacterium]|nr:PIN domain-containing protein [Planctomycetaceae bacterium]
MNNPFILDACALIALLANEPGAENVIKIIQDAIDGDIIVKINQINLLEVYYDVCKIYGEDAANNALETIRKLPIEIIVGLSDEVFRKAGQIKSKYKIPLGDAIAMAECKINNGILVTSDHKDFEPMEKLENLKINWFRDVLKTPVT